MRMPVLLMILGMSLAGMAGCNDGGDGDDDSSGLPGDDDASQSGDDDATAGDDDATAGDDDATAGDDDATSGDDDASLPGDDDASAPGDDDASPTGDDDATVPGDDDASQPGDDDASPTGDDDASAPGDDDASAPGDDDASPTGDDDASAPGDDDASAPGDDDASPAGDDDASLPGDDDATAPTDADQDGYAAAIDCDDTDPAIYPGALELCDDADNDCDGTIDEPEAADASIWYEDVDGDGFGDPGSPLTACDPPTGYVTDDTDCDDDAAQIYPGALEVCDTLDNDCDAAVDEDAVDAPTFYTDQDGDGFGDPASPVRACSKPPGTATLDTDCDDTQASIHPGAAEYCDGIDHDCDGLTDEAGSIDATVFYADQDGDGFGDASAPTSACSQPTGYVADMTDCDDGSSAVHPGAAELCNRIDDDCDGQVDEDATDASTFYADTDGDSFGDPGAPVKACATPTGYVADDTDCDDEDAAISPAGLEVCDTADNDCDGRIDEAGAWWDTAWSYRIPVTIKAPKTDVAGPPIAIEVDFRAALDALGDSAAFDPGSMRVVLQDCATGQPELPSQFLDRWVGLFDKEPYADPAGDEAGTVVFLYDTDGDYSSLETLPADATVQAALYFGPGIAAPTYPTDLTATPGKLANALTAASFDATHGGVLSGITYKGSPSMMSQAESCCGNSLYTQNWVIDPQDAPGTITVLEQGPVFAALEASGTRADSYGGYDYSYTYWMFTGRPELWSKVEQVTSKATTDYHSGDFTNGIRPWESVQTNISGSSGATFTVDNAKLYLDVSNGTWGVSWGYAQPPLYLIALSNYNPYFIAVGNDIAPATGKTPYTLDAGTTYMDNIVQIVLPHAGGFSTVDKTLQGLMQGTHAAAGAPEAW
jgi:hypothetical protein